MKIIITLFMLLPLLVVAESTKEESKKEKNISFSIWEGYIIAGYVDKGAYLNFTGPAIKWKKKSFTLLAGVLPSLRFKKDNNEVSNSFVMPSLGAGLTLSYKHFALQLPVFYNPKTSAVSGRWHPGIGIGYKF